MSPYTALQTFQTTRKLPISDLCFICCAGLAHVFLRVRTYDLATQPSELETPPGPEGCSPDMTSPAGGITRTRCSNRGIDVTTGGGAPRGCRELPYLGPSCSPQWVRDGVRDGATIKGLKPAAALNRSIGPECLILGWIPEIIVGRLG